MCAVVCVCVCVCVCSSVCVVVGEVVECVCVCVCVVGRGGWISKPNVYVRANLVTGKTNLLQGVGTIIHINHIGTVHATVTL